MFDSLSEKAYNLLIGVFILYGALVNVLICSFCADIFMNINIVVFLIAYFVLCTAGSFMCRSKNALIAFIGYNLIVVPIGALLSMVLVEYEAVSILNICFLTGAITLVMTIVSCFYSDFFLSLGKTLPISLCIVLVVEIIMALFGIIMPTFWDLIVAALFCLYIGYDWQKAQEEDKTLCNAISASADLYLDIANLFIRLLASGGKKRD